MEKQNMDILTLINESACFDLQFRKDTRHERTNSPTYYRWKIQFIITVSKEKSKILEKVKSNIGCGKIHVSADQARFSVQNINEIADAVVPFLKNNKLSERKKNDFSLWQKAVSIIHSNKGKYIATWKKNDLLSLIEIHKSSAKYKNNPKEPKWIEMAKSLAKTV